MRLPRDLSGDDFIRALGRFGYRITRQSGSHVRLSTEEGGTHRLTIPRHKSLRVGTLAAAINDVALHFAISREAVAEKLFS